MASGTIFQPLNLASTAKFYPIPKADLIDSINTIDFEAFAEAVGVAATSVGTLLSRAERRFAEAAEQLEITP